MSLTCAEVRDLAPAFVLGALEKTEMAAVRGHLAACAEAHEEIERLGGVVAYLGDAVEAVEPPAALKARILAAAAVERQTTERPMEERPAIPTDPKVAERPARRSASVLRFPAPSARPSMSLGAWAMRLAAVLAIVALGAWSLNLQGRLDASERYAQGVATVLSAAAEPGSQTAILSGGDGGATGIAAVTADGSVVLAMRDLAPTAGSEVYEAWVIVGDAGPVPIGGFAVGSDGTGTFAVTGTIATAGATLALTREPGPGATAPTLPIVSSGVAVAPPG